MDIRSFFGAPAPSAKAKEVQKTTLELLEDGPVNTAKPWILGVLGTSSDSYWTPTRLQEDVLYPILAELERLPDALVLPAEGIVNTYISAWAEKQHLPLTPIQADWQKLGRKAAILRDSRILKDSTHLVLFLGPRSDKLEKVALRELRKGKVVFTVDGKTHELAQLTLGDDEAVTD
jgi:hypothetical protein